MRAGTRVNVEQASKRAMRGPTHLRNGEGRSRRGKRATRAPLGTRRVVTLARMEEEEGGNTGSPAGGEAATERQLVRVRLGLQGVGEAGSTVEAG